MSFKTLAEYVDLDIDHPVCHGLAELDFDGRAGIGFRV